MSVSDEEYRVVLQNGETIRFKGASVKVEFDYDKPAIVISTEYAETVFYWPFVAYYVHRFGVPPPGGD